jgi:hypothetical protein
VEDVVCSHEDYEKLYEDAEVSTVEVLRPLATGSEPIAWKSETEIPPWVIYVLARRA